MDAWGVFAGRRVLCTALCAGIALAATAADATQIRIPKTNPRVTMSIPDGWTVETTDIGVELHSPEKESVILAKVMKRDRTTVNAWTRKVLDRMMTSAGITVDAAKAAAPPASVQPDTAAATAPTSAPAQASSAPPAATQPPMAAPVQATTVPAQVASAPSAPMPTIAAPALVASSVAKSDSASAAKAPPGPAAPGPTKITSTSMSLTPPPPSLAVAPPVPMMLAQSAPMSFASPTTTVLPPSPQQAAAPPVEQPIPGNGATPSFAILGGPQVGGQEPAPSDPPAPSKAPQTIHGLHFQVIGYLGGKFKDKPTDIQLVLFDLSASEVFAVEQQSLPTDNRAVDIISTVTPVKH